MIDLCGPAPTTVPGLRAKDDAESATYTDTIAVNGLNGGCWWGGAYVDKLGNVSLKSYDSMESYADAADVNDLNGGSTAFPFGGAYVDKVGDKGVWAYDNMESYTDNDAVNGLNGNTTILHGTTFNGAYVDR